MHVNFLLIGQGISGTWLSYYLQKMGASVMVVDNADPHQPSRIAAGIINPVTGRRHVEVWMADTLHPFAFDVYHQLGQELNINAITQKNIIDFFPSPQMRISFMERVQEKNKYMTECIAHEKYREMFNYDFGCGEISPAYMVQLESILPAWRQQLIAENKLREDQFSQEGLAIQNDRVEWKDITADKLIFCDGTGSADSPWFNRLPFAPNKGEVLLLDIPQLSAYHIYKKGMVLAPLARPGQWWCGSSYEWSFADAAPTESFREKTVALLKSWLKVPFTVTDHLAGVRPATLERRPFIGIHPLHSSIGIFNGMGTKGCSLAPFFAKQFAEHLCNGKSLNEEVDITRFRNILSRGG